MVEFLNTGGSDHSPLLLKCGVQPQHHKRQFKFLNCLSDHDEFLPVVSRVWNVQITGVHMYRLWSKLKMLRSPLKSLMHYYSHVDLKLAALRETVDFLQTSLQSDPLNVYVFSELSTTQQELVKWSLIEEKILKQKAEIHWLKCGDGNNKFFHASLSSRKRGGIDMLIDSDGRKLVDDCGIKQEVLNFYKKLLGTPALISRAVDIDIERRGKLLTASQRVVLVQPVTSSEVYSALLSIGDDKAPGIDGYSAKFFKAAWSVVGHDVTVAVKNFFRIGKMLKSINVTLITLLPKHHNASHIKDYRPIACCTMLYKLISKILTCRMSRVMSCLVGEEQAAFVPGRFIHDNTILAQELIRGYGRKQLSPRCMLKVDLQKAYSPIGALWNNYFEPWDFLVHLLVGWSQD